MTTKPPEPNPVQQQPITTTTTMSYLDLLEKLKRLKPKPIDPSLGILGFFFVTLIFFRCCVFYLDYRLVTKDFRVRGKTQNFLLLGLDERIFSLEGKLKRIFSLEGKLKSFKRVGFLDEGGEGCDLFTGKWVWDEMYPLYQSRDCPFMDQGFRCSENGRHDSFYTKWRWQPKDCNLPRFDAKTMLEKLRNRRLVFVGDSIGRNQWESLLCMLSSVVPNKESIYEVNGSPITKHKGFLVFKFKDYNCTVEYYRAPFLVVQGRPPAKAPEKAKTTLRLDQMDWTSRQWKDADVLVFNTGHRWNYGKTIGGGCYFQEGEEVKVEMSVNDAYRRSIRTLINWIGRDVNTNKTQVFFHTYAPVHFRGGDWRSGGSCHLETLPELSSSLVPSQTFPQLNIVNEVFSEQSNKSQMKQLDVLNVTYMSSWRRDGHCSIYYMGPDTGPAPIHRQDCSHWCLPGVPDVWNELLYALFLRREANHTKNSMTSTQVKA